MSLMKGNLERQAKVEKDKSYIKELQNIVDHLHDARFIFTVKLPKYLERKEYEDLLDLSSEVGKIEDAIRKLMEHEQNELG